MKNIFRTAALLILITPFVITYFIYIKSSGITKEDYLTKGIIRVGYAVEAPYAFTDKSGNPTGESPETAKEIIRRLGIKNTQWIQTEFDLLIDELINGRFDVIASGMFITPERASIVSFSEPSFHVNQALLTNKNEIMRVNKYSDLLNYKGIKITVLSGSFEEQVLLKTGFNDKSIIRVPDAVSGKTALDHGLADCLSLSSPSIRWIIKNSPGSSYRMIEMIDPANGKNGSTGFGAFAFRKDDKEFVSKWNTQMEIFIGSKEHLQIISKFGFSENEIPTARQQNIF